MVDKKRLELTEGQIREIVREEIWLILKKVEAQKLEDIRRAAAFVGAINPLRPP